MYIYGGEKEKKNHLFPSVLKYSVLTENLRYGKAKRSEKEVILKIYLFVFGCAGSSLLLPAGFP